MNQTIDSVTARIHGHCTLPVTPLAGIDLNSGFMPVRRVFYYVGTPDITRLQESLALALAQWPDFSGSLVLHNGMASLDRNDVGVPFTVEAHATSVPLFGIDHPLGLPCTFCDDGIGKTFGDGGPVFTVKLSVYNDNHWVLGTCNSHALCDGSGYWQFMQSWRDAYHGVVLQKDSSESLRIAAKTPATNADTLPANLCMPPVKLQEQQVANLAAYRTKQRYVPEATLVQLKNSINASLAPHWVSTQDVMMAWIWQSLAKIAVRHGVSIQQFFPLANVINVRARLGLKQYTGNMVYSVISSATLATIVDTPLALLAQQLRNDSEQVSNHDINHFLAFMQEQLAAGNYNNDGYFTQFSSHIAEDCVNGTGVMVNNWSKFPAYQMDFSGAPLWFDLATVIPMHFAMVMPAVDGVVLRLFLPETQLTDIFHVMDEALAF
jgi:hypothetical protein